MTNICMYICAMISGNLRNLQIVQHNELCEDVPKRVLSGKQLSYICSSLKRAGRV